MVQGDLFAQAKEYRIGVVMVVPAHPPTYPKPKIYINYYKDFYYYKAICRAEGDLFDYETPEQAEAVARQRAEIVVTSFTDKDDYEWGRIIETGGYRLIQGKVAVTSYRILANVHYLLDGLDRIYPLYHPDELPFYDPLIQQHYQALKKEAVQ